MRGYHWWRTVFFLIPAIGVYTIVLWLILKTSGVKVEVTGLERLDPSRSYIFAVNHQSIYDIPIMFTSLPVQLRILSKASVGRVPFLGWHLLRTGHVLVDRSKPGAAVIKKLARLVK